MPLTGTEWSSRIRILLVGVSGLLLLSAATIAPAQTRPSVPIPSRHVRISAKVVEQRDSRSWSFGPEKGIIPGSEWKNTRSSSTFFLLVADGQEGRISVGESVANGQWFYQYSVNHGYIARGSVFRSVSTGFRVVPIILPGEQIRLQITPEISYFTDQGQGQIAFVESRLEAVVVNGQSVTVAANRHETESVLFNIMRGFESRTGSSTLVMTLTPEIQ
ncbi:MAG: hypothetical protein ACE5K9_04895 [Candidatus Methylomirabilales bacterium]